MFVPMKSFFIKISLASYKSVEQFQPILFYTYVQNFDTIVLIFKFFIIYLKSINNLYCVLLTRQVLGT